MRAEARCHVDEKEHGINARVVDVGNAGIYLAVSVLCCNEVNALDIVPYKDKLFVSYRSFVQIDDIEGFLA